jgi:hypothetical protein
MGSSFGHPRGLALIALLALSHAGRADARGLAARLGDAPATAGDDYTATLDVEDPHGLVARVELAISAQEGEAWLTATATRTQARWSATFPASALYPGRERPAQLLLRARVFGPRGGLLLALGEPDPMPVEVETRAEAVLRRRLEARYRADVGDAPEDDVFTLNGCVGTEVRAGAAARARAVIGAGGALSARSELWVYVVVGPAFAAPAELAGGGPLSLGFEAAWRGFARAPSAGPWTTFAEGFVTADLRLPGLDAGGGARVGALLRLGRGVAVEGSLFGAVLAWRAADPDGREAVPAAVGGLRVALRLARDEEPAP